MQVLKDYIIITAFYLLIYFGWLYIFLYLITVDQKNISRDAFETLNEWLMLGGKDTTQEQILLNIEAVHARIRKVKVRLEDLMKANNQELPLSQEFVGPGNLSNSVARSLYSSPGHNEDALLHETPHTPKNHVPEYESDVVWPGSTVSSYGDDIVENTMDLFSAAHSDQHFVDSCKDVSAHLHSAGLLHY